MKISGTYDGRKRAMNDERIQFMREAIRLSLENVRTGRGGPFAAVVVKDGAIIARGTNLVISTNDPTAHAEIEAIRQACTFLGSFQLDQCELYCSCEPCPMCHGAIYWARPERVFYGNTKQDASEIDFDDSFIYEEFLKPLTHRKLPMEQLLREEALAAFNEWKIKEGKVKY